MSDQEQQEPQEQRPRGRGRGRGRGHGNRGQGGRPRGRGGRVPQNIRKDSYYYKYRFGPWPEQKDEEITLETEIPEFNRTKTKPDKDTYVKEMEAFDEKIKAEREKIQKINAEKRAIIEGVREKRKKEDDEKNKKQSGQTFNDVLQEKKDFLVKFRAKKDQIDAVNKEIKEIQGEELVIEKNTSKKFKSGQDVNMRLQEIDQIMQTTSISPGEERELHKEKIFLEKSMEFAERFDALRPKKKALFDK